REHADRSARRAPPQHGDGEPEAEREAAQRRAAAAGGAAARALVVARPAHAAAHAVVATAEAVGAIARLARLDAVLRAVVVGAQPRCTVGGSVADLAQPTGGAGARDAAAADACVAPAPSGG